MAAWRGMLDIPLIRPDLRWRRAPVSVVRCTGDRDSLNLRALLQQFLLLPRQSKHGRLNNRRMRGWHHLRVFARLRRALQLAGKIWDVFISRLRIRVFELCRSILQAPGEVRAASQLHCKHVAAHTQNAQDTAIATALFLKPTTSRFILINSSL